MSTNISPVLVADLQRRCESELGRSLTLAEAEQLGQRLLSTFQLMFDVHERDRVHRSSGTPPLTKKQTNGMVHSSQFYAAE